MLLNAANAERDMSALIARVLEYRVFAIVVMTGTPPARIVEECLNNGVPVILVNKLLPDWPSIPSLPTTPRADGSPRNSCWPRVAAGSRSSRARRVPRA